MADQDYVTSVSRPETDGPIDVSCSCGWTGKADDWDAASSALLAHTGEAHPAPEPAPEPPTDDVPRAE